MAQQTKQPFTRIDPATLDAVESGLGIELPADYREFLLSSNGAYPERNTFTLTGGRQFIHGHADCLFGIQSGHADDLVAAQKKAELPAHHIAVGRDEEGRIICIDCGPGESYGTVYFHYPKGDDASERPPHDLYRAGDSFSDFLSTFWDGHLIVDYWSDSFKLFYKDRLIGVITNIETDFPHFTGDLKATPAFEDFREGFEFLMNDEDADRFVGELPIDLDNWFVENERGVKKLASVGIHDNGTYAIWRSM